MIAAHFDPFSGGGAAAYAWAFGQGVLVDLTPCVYPLIPITVAVFGAKGVSRPRALFLAAAYVLGMATLYTALGVVVALSGGQFGAWLANPWVVVPIATLLLALAASMFGAFDLQLPGSLQTRLNTVGGAGPFGAFLMGLVSGFISAPCTGPVLLSLLAYIAKASAEGSSVLYGASLLFVYALGMGTLFFAVALGASLFRPGPWMEYVKSFFGVALIVMALWFLGPVVPVISTLVLDPAWGLWAGLGLATVGLVLGAIHLSFYGPPVEKLRKAIAVGVTVFGAQLTINNLLYASPAAWHEVTTFDELQATLDEAKAANKPLVVDFSATWCLPCKELDLQTFHHPDVERLLAERFHLVKIDVTDPTEDQMTMQAGFDSGTLPSVLIYAADFDANAILSSLRADGTAPKPAARFKTFVEADVFLDTVQDIR